MSKITGTFHNVETGQVEVRELTVDELEDFDAQSAEQERIKAEEAAATAAKSALLAKLGITEDEAKLLLG